MLVIFSYCIVVNDCFMDPKKLRYMYINFIALKYGQYFKILVYVCIAYSYSFNLKVESITILLQYYNSYSLALTNTGCTFAHNLWKGSHSRSSISTTSKITVIKS